VAYYGSIGLAAAVAVRTEGRRQAVYLLATFLGTVIVRLIADGSVAVGVAFGISNVVEAAVFALLARRDTAATSMINTAAVVRLFGISVVTVVIGGIVVAPGMALLNIDQGAAEILLVRVIGHLTGILAIAPLVLLGSGVWQSMTRRAVGELAIAVAALIVCLELGFSDGKLALGYPYAPLAVALFAAVRLGTPAAITVPPFLVPLSLWQTLAGDGPFAKMAGDVSEQVLAVQIYALTATLSCLLVAALQNERGATLGRLRTANVELERRVAARTSALAKSAEGAHLAAEVSQALADARLDPTSTLHAIADRMVASWSDLCVISRMSNSTQAVVPVVVDSRDRGLRTAAEQVWLPLRINAASKGLTGLSLATRKSVRVAGAPAELAELAHPALASLFTDHDLHSVLVAPMHADGVVVGVLTLIRNENPEPFDEADEQLLQDVADRAGLALANARLHSALQDSVRRFRAAFDDGPVGMAIVSLDPRTAGTYLQVNAALCRLTGYSAEQLVGMGFSELTHPDDRDPEYEPSEQLVSGGRTTYLWDKRLLRADGETIWVQTTASVVSGAEGSYAFVHLLDITASKESAEELARKALYDPVTGLPNRHLFNDHLSLALARLRRRSEVVAVLFLDLDDFKAINDELGHEVGDGVLAAIGARLGGCMRAQDTPARLGGDEFVAVCPDIGTEAGARSLALRVASAVSAPLEVLGHTLEPRTSVGVALTASADADPHVLLREADLAMYMAKRRGGNQVEVYRATVPPGAPPGSGTAVKAQPSDADGRVGNATRDSDPHPPGAVPGGQ
jgi:diguanylate cyclase (GGDEF)-like protein/PAS domain S-box-containing protein